MLSGKWQNDERQKAERQNFRITTNLKQLWGSFFLWRASLAKVDLRGWALRPPVVNKSINLGTIDLAIKVQSSEITKPMHCLKKWRSCDVIKAPSKQPAFVYFYGEIPHICT